MHRLFIADPPPLPMLTLPTSVLLVEADPKEAREIEQALATPDPGNGQAVVQAFRIESVTTLAGALQRLRDMHFDIVLLDLGLPDAQGIGAFDQVLLLAPAALVLILCAPNHEETARQVVQRGAHDYLIKGHLDAHWLPRALRYVLERKAAQDELFAEKERAQVTLNSIGDAVLSTDLAGNVSYLNLAAESMTGWSRDDAIGRPLSEVFRIIDSTSRVVAPNPAEHAIRANQTVGLATDCLLIHRDGSESAIEDSAAPIHNRDGRVSGAVIVFHDVSESRGMALKMAHLAQHDFLTGLPNRVLLTERLSQAIGIAHRRDKQVALLFLDLDYFKHINDSLGHAVGDLLLQSVASRLTSCVRATDTVCRQGGDEFVILLAEIDQPEDAAHVAEALLQAFSAPHFIAGHDLHVPLSIGISVFPDDGGDADTILQNADIAMYYAKSSGRNNYQFFRSELNTRAVERLVLENNLRRALRQREFVLFYQPKIDLLSGEMTGAEALIRWLDPQLGTIYPAEFVHVAEESGLIVPIGRWVLREACTQIRRWLDAGLPAVPISVNISAVEFRHKGFLDGVAQVLADARVEARYLELELTESILMHDAESSATVLKALEDMGVQLAIDDFGTGYSSLSYLKRFPIKTLKIDQSFVKDLACNPDDATIVSAVIGMGRNLNQRVVAEGVETREQLDFLRQQACDEGQGFRFSHPLAADDFAHWLVATGGAGAAARFV